VVVYPSHVQLADQLIEQADIIFCLDFNNLSRIHAMEPSIRNAKGMKVMIDHHLSPEGFDDIRHWDNHAAATAQLVYDFIVNQFDDREAITPEIATSLYTGRSEERRVGKECRSRWLAVD